MFISTFACQLFAVRVHKLKNCLVPDMALCIEIEHVGLLYRFVDTYQVFLLYGWMDGWEHSKQ